ncbi:DUF924 domain-containing protein [Falsochrobactrum shanghaiense]|uniref:DUF924 domain-containing protein n=1 Tax=Falsochrobactrum shanghaiense TaxID=2201899 RepID=A0A316J7A5_9HYPH|nr:DUF924 family protein [Falsochrobactrum shanghaiense]PWL17792.1 DUF924 domain-containing protein [Falsochrobactrum shanghaiense]
MAVQPEDILNFWFSPKMRENWFVKSDEIDTEIRDSFLPAYEDARNEKMEGWKQQPESALALTILFDQFPRNMFRGSPRSFESDGLARDIAVQALDHDFDRQLSADQRQFFYLPLMHSEKLSDQKRSVELYEKLADPVSLDFARQHHDIIERFGRFPHRNKVLGRETTAEEAEFLKEHTGF